MIKQNFFYFNLRSPPHILSCAQLRRAWLHLLSSLPPNIYTCSPVPPLPQVEQFQLTQPLFICQVLQSLHQLWGPLLIPLKDPYSHLGLGCPKQDGEDVSKKHILQEMLSSHFRLISRMTSYIFNKKEHFQTNQVFKLIH